MNYEEIIKDVQNIFIEITDNPLIVLTATTTSEDIEEWDSLTHIQLIVAIERYFNINFTAEEIGGYKDVGEMCKGINQKLSV